MTPIQLIAVHGHLAVAFRDIQDLLLRTQYDGADAPLVFVYPAGDADPVAWPEPNLRVLRGALYDARETGLIAATERVRLPDGTEFYIDRPYWKAGDHVTWTDPDDGVCSRTGVLTKADYFNDSELRIAFSDGWEAEVCESELQRVAADPKVPVELDEAIAAVGPAAVLQLFKAQAIIRQRREDSDKPKAEVRIDGLTREQAQRLADELCKYLYWGKEQLAPACNI